MIATADSRAPNFLPESPTTSLAALAALLVERLALSDANSRPSPAFAAASLGEWAGRSEEGSRQAAGSVIRHGDGDGDGLHKFALSFGLGFRGPQVDGRVARDAGP
jgi:hypothetical protein